MIRKILLLLMTGLLIWTQTNTAQAFHGEQISSSGMLAAQADSQTGSAGFAVPIDVPPGRAGIQPSIQLLYNSGLPNGLLGIGWSLEYGAIQRSTKNGVPKYDSSDTFVLVQNGSSQELVYDTGAGFYRTETEGAFMKIVRNGDDWIATDKKGIQYYFGETPSAQEYDPNDTSRVFKWALNSVKDLHGNTMTITYWRDGNKLYPQYIDYTANPQAGLAAFARVGHIWESRNDTMAGYGAGYQTETNYRLKQIDVSVGNNLQYRFVLNYHQSSATGRSILEKITQYGSDGTSALPPLTFQYHEYVNEPAPTYNFVKDGVLSSGISRFFGDFNGDGRMDKAIYYSNQENVHVALSNGASFDGSSLWIGGVPSAGRKLLVGNFDNDGIMDLCVFNQSNGAWEILSSNGQNQFVSKGTWISGFGTNVNLDRGVSTGDFNGDGLTDIVYFYDDPQGKMRAAIALNAGNQFVFDPAATPIVSGSNANGITGDFNGDGLTDLGLWYDGNGHWDIRLNTGNIKAPFQPMFTYSGFGGGKTNVIADFNYDGLTDIGYFDNTATKIVYRLSTGGSFGPEQSSAFNLSTGAPSAVISSADVNGDGLLDFITRDNLNDMDIDYSNGVFPDLLAKSDNGIGGTTTIQYAPSTGYQNTLLPFPLQLVKSVTKSNNRGDAYGTQYDYAQGLWDGAQREFRGFGLVKVTDPGGFYLETQFLQDDVFRGRIAEQRTYDTAGNLYAKAVNTWASQQITPGVDFVYLKRRDQFVYDGDATGRRTAEEFFYEETPQLGNLTRVEQYGEVDLVTGNKSGTDGVRRIKTEYINDTTSWVIGLPSSTRVEDYYNNTLRKTLFYYDAKGLLTKKEDWAGGGSAVNPVTQYSYDTLGNLLTTTDPKGNVTAITYDTGYKMFPLVTQNALGHQVKNEYYGVNGVPLVVGSDGLQGLWGQVKSTTDPNQKQGTRAYDMFGRLAATIGPLNSIFYPTQTTAIEYGTDYTKVTARQWINYGQSQTVDTVSFYDGLGRLIQTKTPTEVAGRYAVSGQARYDSRGLKNEQYLPYFSANPVDVIEPIDTARPHSTIDYDAVGRVTKTINADGTYANIIYNDWTTAAIDENGHKQESVFDAYGRLIEKREFTGADGRSSFYSPIPYTLYAKTLYFYDSEGNLAQTRDAYNNITTITYDALGRKIAMNDPDMGAWSYVYDLNGNLTRQTDAKGQALNFTYDALNRLTNKNDGGTLNVSYTYDNAAVTNSKGRLTQAAYPGGNTTFTYDELGRELQSIKTMNTTSYGVNRSYDALNNLLQIQYPDQKNIYYQYNPAGQIEKISNDPVLLDQQSFNLRNDGQETLLAVRWRDSNRPSSDVLRTDDGQRTPIRATSPTTAQTILAWLERHVFGVDEAEAAPAAPVLNAPVAGNAQVGLTWNAVSGATGYKVKYDTVSGGGVIPKDFTKDIDCVGAWKLNETSGTVTDSCKANHGTVSGTLKRGVAGKYNQGIEFFGYASGNNALVNFGSATPLDNLRPRTLVAWIKPHNLGEGSKGTIFSKNYQDGWVLRLAANNNIAFSQAFSGGVVTWTTTTNAVKMNTWQHVAVAYAGSGTSAVPVIYINGVAQATSRTGTPSGTIDNDAAFNLLFGIQGGVQEFDGVIDEAAIFKRVLTLAEITSILNNRLDGGLGKTYATQLDMGNVTNYTVTGLTNGTTYYFAVSAYNAGGESGRSNEKSAMPSVPITAEDPTLFVKNVDYNPAGQITKIEYGNGDATTYTYNPLNLRLTRLYTVNAQLQPVQDLNYTYDAVGNILSIDDKVNTADQTFKYDALNRLVEANGQSYGTKTYVYDTIGNIVQKDGKTYFYGDGNAGPHAVTALSDGTIFTYDANGNMITKVEAGVTTAYTYDAENRLLQVRKGGSIIGQYTYDGDGGRTTKVATISGQTTTTTFVGSLFETSGARNTKFIFLGDQRVASITSSPTLGSNVLYYHADHLGGANVLTDATGFKKELIEYEPFGLESRHEKYGSSEEVAWYYFTGKPKDDETGLYYFGARYYDPKLGRFITADTIVQNPYNSQTLNRYSYAGNNPVNNIDPTGHSWFSKFWKKVWKAIEKPFIAAVTAAAVVLTWGAVTPGITATAALFSSAGATIVASAAATTAVLETHEGQRFIKFLSNSVFDDAFGMSPRTANLFGTLAAYMTVNTTFQFGFAQLTGPDKTLTSKDFDPKSEANQATAKEILKEGKGVNYGTRPGVNPKTGEIENVAKILYNGDEVVGLAAEALKIGGQSQHLGVVLKGLQMQSGMVSFFDHPFQALSKGYLTFGISHTAVNISLLNAGYQTTVNSLLSGGWTTAASTFVYGPYGGGLTGAITYEKIKN